MSDHSHEHADDEVHVHIHSWKLYAGILGTLLFLTVLTVAVSYVDIDAILALGRPVEGVGAWNLGVAVLIATIKATFVVLFFMHLKDDARFNALFFVGSLLFVGIFLAYTMNDTLYRGETGDRYNGVQIDPDTGLRAPGGVAGEIPGEALEQGLASTTGLAAHDGDYAAWGAELFGANGCTACHAVEAGAAAMVGPNLHGIANTMQPLASGEEVMADEAYLRQSLREPQAQIVEGYENAVMPAFASLPDDEIQALVAYVVSLGGAAEAEAAMPVPEAGDEPAAEEMVVEPTEGDEPTADEPTADEPAADEPAPAE